MRKFIKNLAKALPYLFVFIYSLSYSKDPDLGWHLRYGEYFIKNFEVLRDNIFSSQMTNYHWVNGGWFGDVFIYLIFNFFGFFGLTIVGALIAVLTFYFFGNSVRTSLLNKLFIFPPIAFCVVNINSSSFRGQQLSLLLIGVLVFLLMRMPFKLDTRGKLKQISIISLIFLVWANLHQQSTMGLGILFLWTFITFFTHKKEFKHLAIASLLSFVATLINPFGFGIYIDSIAHLKDPLLKTISEYQPFIVSTLDWWKLVTIFITTLVLFSNTLLKKKHIGFLRIFVTMLFFLLMAFSNRRFAWPGYYLFIPFLASYLTSFPIRKNVVLKTLIMFFFSILLLVVLFNKVGMLRSIEDWDLYCKNLRTPCSTKASDYLEKNYTNYMIYTYYNWGGYLIWNNPNIKPSTDGRMHLWRDEKGYGAYEYDYLLELGKESIDNSSYNVAFIPHYKTGLYMQLARLIALKKWKLVYEDKYALIIIRK